MSQAVASFPAVSAGTNAGRSRGGPRARPVDRLAARLFPSACPGCGAPGEPLCPGCARGLARAVPAPAPPGLDLLVAPLSYEGAARELVARLKYRNARHAVAFLAGILGAALREGPAREAVIGPGRGPDRGPDRGGVVTWVPTTPARRRARGFDHAELLARAVGRELGRPVVPLLSRPPGPAQTGRPRAERRRAAPCFEPSGGGWVGPVVVVDDVVTTGATLGAAARTLRRAGATGVVGAVVARTPPPWRREPR